MNEGSTASGASKASDFQPPTQNPQSASPNLQPTTQGLQPTDSSGSSQGQFNQLPASPLEVETAQSGSKTTVTPVNTNQPSGLGFLPGLLIFAAILLAAVLVYKRLNLFAPAEDVAQPLETPEPTVQKKPKKTAKTKSKAKKKSKSKK
jgi:hypothetical protein